MTGINGIRLFLVFPLYFSQGHVVNEIYGLTEKGRDSSMDPGSNNQSRLILKEPSLPINELLEKNSKSTESKLVWPKHSDLAPILRQHNKSKKGPKTNRLIEQNSEKNRVVVSLLPKIQLPGAAGVNRTAQKSNQDPQVIPSHSSEAEGHPNSRPRAPSSTQPQVHLQQPAASPHRDPLSRRPDPEENRPGKASLHSFGIGSATWNNSRSPLLFNRRSSSLLYQFDIVRRESDFMHDSFCISECRKEKDEREYYCYSEFAVNGIVHDIDVLPKGIRLITLMVSSDGFYKMGHLYVTPETFFFKVRLFVLDSFKCSKPCPDIKLGTRYIVMGQIYHRRRHLPSDLLNLLGGKLKPGDGLVRSNNYAKRFNKRRHQKVLEATRSRCR
ncbi:UPF0450 protein C17orf58 homolog isoform X1 [Oryzias latipes]|uniref:Chromosome 17 open reading frame 58 n=1 Tax=Oryzias latipes TaxID=8090 RepID=A0A3B3I7X8_ORYLA|nr:UPF0450 protein C17orf58 homolog isoform X1 [Oryzias latipes]